MTSPFASRLARSNGLRLLTLALLCWLCTGGSFSCKGSSHDNNPPAQNP
jgi:hypothetical protein